MTGMQQGGLIVRGSAMTVALVVGAATAFGDLLPAQRADGLGLAAVLAGLVQVAMVLGVWQANGYRASFITLFVCQWIPVALVKGLPLLLSSLGVLPPMIGHALFVVTAFAVTLAMGVCAQQFFRPRSDELSRSDPSDEAAGLAAKRDETPGGAALATPPAVGRPRDNGEEIAALLLGCSLTVALLVLVPGFELALVVPVHLAMVLRILALQWESVALGRIYLCLIAVPFYDVFALVSIGVVGSLYPWIGKFAAPPLGFYFTYGLGRFVRDLTPPGQRARSIGAESSRLAGTPVLLEEKPV